MPPSSTSPSLSTSLNHIAIAAVAIKAVLFTAVAFLVLSGIWFFIYRKFFVELWRRKFNDGTSFNHKVETNKKRFSGLKVWFVKDNVDILCKTKPEAGARTKTKFSEIVCNSSYGDDQEEEKRVDTIFTRRTKTSRLEETAESTGLEKKDHHVVAVRTLSDSDIHISPSQFLPPLPPPPPPPPPPHIIIDNEIRASPPPPPPPEQPSGSSNRTSVSVVAPQPLHMSRMTPAPPPPDPKGMFSSKPPQLPKGKANKPSSAGTMKERSDKKLKPLHWDKVVEGSTGTTRNRDFKDEKFGIS